MSRFIGEASLIDAPPIGTLLRALERSSCVQEEHPAGDTGGMRRPSRLRQPRLLRRDWIGDGVLTLVAGAVLLVGVFLPWVNEDGPAR